MTSPLWPGSICLHFVQRHWLVCPTSHQCTPSLMICRSLVSQFLPVSRIIHVMIECHQKAHLLPFFFICQLWLVLVFFLMFFRERLKMHISNKLPYVTPIPWHKRTHRFHLVTSLRDQIGASGRSAVKTRTTFICHHYLIPCLCWGITTTQTTQGL